MRVTKKNDEVLIAQDAIVTIEPTFITTLKQRALQNPRKRIRLCVHKNVNDTLHEMFIVHTKDTYVRPHKHLHKVESLHIIEGRADIFLFDEKGRTTQKIKMGDYTSGLTFYYRLDLPIYHTMVIKSDYLVFHEVTSGPFKKSDIIFAPWSPDERDSVSVKKYIDTLVKGTKI